ncbi:response regulator transcription factor [Slackia piriformis]|uniref:response regulator transcription factor n=1 Tax=Slackia piriformis TaxID=626934 RepID=UPI0026DD2208|nr:helix-turn-helix transcriptional regulator [Slackia piriformis]MDO5023976.1 helix-turn-helix transcriptional regulator [Slackia piriformis]
MNTQTNTSQNRTRRRIQLEGIGAFLLALGCARAWLTLLFVAPEPPLGADIDAHRIFDYFYFAAALCMALCARRISSLGDTKWATPTLAILMLSASFFCGVPTLFENEGEQAFLTSFLQGLDRTMLSFSSLFVGSVFGGVGFCLFLLLWAETLSHMSLAKIALFTALSQVFAVVLVYFCQGFDQTRFFLALFLLPAIAVLALTHAWNRIKAQDEHTIAPCNKSWSSLPWKLILLTAILCFTYGLRSHQLAEGAGMHSSVSTAMAMAVFAGFVYFLSDRISLNALVKSALPLTLCGFLLIPSEGFLGTVVSSYMISAGYSFMTLLVALMLYDISKRFGIMVLLLFCLKNAMQVFVVWGKDFASMIERSGLAPGTQEAVLIIIVVALISSMAFILYSEKGLTSTWGVKFIETDLLDEQGREEKARTTLCDHLSSKHRLSPREDEILRLYAQGLNGPQIERELFIAEGTLKTHTRHIYEKLGISNRKELYALLGVK